MPNRITGYMLFLPDGKPVNCVGSLRVFWTRDDAGRYLTAAYRKRYGITIEPVEVGPAQSVAKTKEVAHG